MPNPLNHKWDQQKKVVHYFVGITINGFIEYRRFPMNRPYPSPDHWVDLGHVDHPDLVHRLNDFIRKHNLRLPLEAYGFSA